MASYRSTRTDENTQFERASNLRLVAAKGDTLNSVAPRRPALGDLANKTQRNNQHVVDIKKGSNGEIGNTLSNVTGIDLKKIKPRVDTHWANQPVTRKIVTRSNSLKLSSANVAVIPTVTGPKLVKARSTTTATVKEAKLTKVKLEKSESLDRPQLTNGLGGKRQESITSGKLITKARVAVKTESNGSAKLSSGDSGKHIKEELVEQKLNKVKEEKLKSTETKENQFELHFPAHSTNLLYQFNDIDADDDYNPLLVSEYVNDIYSYLYHLETTYAIRKNHLEGQRDVFPRMRAVLIDWINEVHLQYRFAQETFHMAVSLIDRYLQVVSTTSRQNLQLVGVASLFIASKYEELYPPEVKDFVYITDDTYTREQVIQMEKHILKKLKFELGCPLPIHFLRRYSKAATSNADTHIMSKYFLELASVDYKMCQYLPSEIAAASLFISLCLASLKSTQFIDDYDSLWTITLQYYTTYTLDKLKPIIKQLAEIILNAPTAKLNNVYKKYSSTKLNEVALITTFDNPVKCLHDICSDL